MIIEPSSVLGKNVAVLAEGPGRDVQMAYVDGYRLAVEAFYRELNRLKQEDFGAERPAAVLIERIRAALKGMTTEATNLMRRIQDAQAEDTDTSIEVVETAKAGWGVRCNACDETTVGLDEFGARALAKTHRADPAHRAAVEE